MYSRVRVPYQQGWLWSPSLTPGRESLGWHRTWPRQWSSLLAPAALSSAAEAASSHCYGPGVGTGDVVPAGSHAPSAESLPTVLGCACPGLREESCPTHPKSKCCLYSDHRACPSPIFFYGDEFHSESNPCPSNCGLSIFGRCVFTFSWLGHSLFAQPRLAFLPLMGYPQGQLGVLHSVPVPMQVSWF